MFALPQGLARAGITVRAARPDDRPFLRALFATARLDAAFLAQWPAAEREHFLDSQFHFQDRHFSMAYGDADFLVVEHNGAAVGRLIVLRGAGEWSIVDISLMPQTRGQGLGEGLLRAVHDAARAAGAGRLSLHVEVGNRARRLYERLGFVETEDEGSHIAMSWKCA